jgi:hypothetical protein
VRDSPPPGSMLRRGDQAHGSPAWPPFRSRWRKIADSTLRTWALAMEGGGNLGLSGGASGVYYAGSGGFFDRSPRRNVRQDRPDQGQPGGA